MNNCPRGSMRPRRLFGLSFSISSAIGARYAATGDVFLKRRSHRAGPTFATRPQIPFLPVTESQLVSHSDAETIILVTNDDGITAPGIRNLVEAVRGLGTVVVVAPDSPQSGMGHAITIGHPLRLERVDIFGPDIEAWQ